MGAAAGRAAPGALSTESERSAAVEVDSERLLSSRDLAGYLGVSEATVSRWRTFNRGPRFLDLSGIARYRRADVEDWLAEKESR